MILLSVKYTARPGGGEKFVREITDSGILDAVRAEDGCISYDYYFSAESPDTVLLMGFARAAGSASSIGAHGRADEDKGEIYFKHGSRKSRFIKSFKSAKSLKIKASVKRMPLFVERSRKTLLSVNRHL